jgi:hypothetical protein
MKVADHNLITLGCTVEMITLPLILVSYHNHTLYLQLVFCLILGHIKVTFYIFLIFFSCFGLALSGLGLPDLQAKPTRLALAWLWLDLARAMAWEYKIVY